MRMPACSENEVNDKDTDDNNNDYNNNKLPPSDINSSKFPPEILGGFDENATGLEQVGKTASPGFLSILCNSAHLYIHVYQNPGPRGFCIQGQNPEQQLLSHSIYSTFLMFPAMVV